MIEMQGNPMPAGGFVMTFTDITPFRDAERVLREANEHLEARVAERTHELSELNRQLLLVNQQVERANHSKSRFLAAVSHDLTQPLNAAKLFTSSLLEMLPPADEPARIARHIDDALGATEDLITDLLDISRLEAGKFKAKKLDFALRDVFDNLKAEFGVLAQAGIQFSVVESGVAVYSDVRLLRRVLQNFLTNAFRYNPGGGCCSAAAGSATRCASRCGTTAPAFSRQAGRRSSTSSPASITPAPRGSRGWGSALPSPAASPWCSATI